jgi:DNA-binding transcriptional regulator YiaG
VTDHYQPPADLDDRIERLIQEMRQLPALPPVPERVRIREAAGVTQAEMAAVLGCSTPAISKWENGERVPTKFAMLAYGKLLDALAKLIAERGDQ